MSKEKEIELSWLIEIGDFSGLAEAESFEHHIQFEYRLPDTDDGARRGRVRVRKTSKADQAKYEETLKTPRNETGIGDDEFPIEITEEYFKAWVKTFGNKGISKTRYFYSAQSANLVEGVEMHGIPVVLEVDIFTDAAGKRFKFAKLDIEVHGLLDELKQKNIDLKEVKFKADLSTLPLKIGKIIPLGKQTDEEKALTADFFKAVNCIEAV